MIPPKVAIVAQREPPIASAYAKFEDTLLYWEGQSWSSDWNGTLRR